ncbi:hypothetical protein I3J27_14040 [Bradyrhizobium xenonodulans]|uniref:Pilus assembly protein n=1 Tax=Bradyrhizobium xenonodulans TaxID=2736875 RepID=A0ABY7MU73_9BRAD|nr:hypothetical protein [Bradyrhizobium xenonodulans]WBL81481.1 hypothetical protein I3J27_14040 [Bradyrhizobium xenonodulans]
MHSLLCRKRLVRGERNLFADQRGAVAFEMPFVYLFLIMLILLPLADLAVAGYRYISALAALRAFGQSIQYSQPPDVTNASSWASAALAKADSRYPIPSITLICGDSNAVCAAGNSDPALAKYYVYSTTITLAPIVLTSVLCTSTTGNACSFTLSYSERFQ